MFVFLKTDYFLFWFLYFLLIRYRYQRYPCDSENAIWRVTANYAYSPFNICNYDINYIELHTFLYKKI